MTWKEMHDEVKNDAGALVSLARITTLTIFKDLTKARQRMQYETGALRKTMDILTSSLDGSGAILCPYDVNTIDSCEFIGVGTTIPSQIINPISSEEFQCRVRGLNTLGYPSSNYSPACLSITKSGGKLLLYPFNGVSGTIRLHYKPRLVEYTTSNQSQYFISPTTLDAYLNANGPEPEFDPGINGIMALAKIRTVQKVPGAKKEYREEIRMWMEEWQQGVESVLENDPTYSENTPGQGWFSPVQ